MEEKSAMRMTLPWLWPLCKDVAMGTDSRALCKAIQNDSNGASGVRYTLDNHKGKSTLVWIPDHRGLADNGVVEQSAAIKH